MASGTELAKAYVQIIPSAEGIKGKITEALGGEADIGCMVNAICTFLLHFTYLSLFLYRLSNSIALAL